MRGDNGNQGLDSGNVLIAVLFVVIVLGALVAALNRSALGSHHATLRNEIETKLLYIAETGIHYHSVMLDADPMAPVKDDLAYTADAVGSEYVGQATQLGKVEGIARPFVVRVQYLADDEPVMFANRADPQEPWDRIKVTSTATLGDAERVVVAWFSLEVGAAFSAAVISDAIATGNSGLRPKNQARTGDVVLAGRGRSQQHYLYGGVRANGAIRYYRDHQETGELTTELADVHFGGFGGSLEPSLSGTTVEIPDLTAPGGDDQLFDLQRMVLAAERGSGQVFQSLGDFCAACCTANEAGAALEGIIVVQVDSAAEGTNPVIAERGGLAIPGGIHVRGTLLFRFSNGTDPSYKVSIDVPLAINAADLTGLDPTDETTFRSGYPSRWADPDKAPWQADLRPQFSSYAATDDFPALVFNNGVLAIQAAANVCGVVYGPSFIEIQNRHGKRQYFNGAIIGGAGVLIEGHPTAGETLLRYDANAVRNLVTQGGKGLSLTRVGFAIAR